MLFAPRQSINKDKDNYNKIIRHWFFGLGGIFFNKPES